MDCSIIFRVTKVYRKISSKYFYLALAFLLGLIPAISFIHMFAKDFIGYYVLSESFLFHKAYSFSEVTAYGTNQIGLQARAPLLPALLAISTSLFGNTLFGIYLPILVYRLAITPLAFLVSSFFLPVEIAFLASSMTIFFPKLQTFSLSAFEADSFVLVLYLAALLFYLSYKKMPRKLYLILCGLSLGLLSLTKELGLPISVGFITAFIFEQLLDKSLENKNRLKNIVNLVVPFFLLITPFFLFTLAKTGVLYFSAVTADRSVKYLLGNLPFLFKTIPMYIGLEELTPQILSLKSNLVNFVILICLLVGLTHSLFKKNLTLIFPILVTIIALGTVSSNALGGKIPGNFELITIFAFAMPIAAILIFKGLLVIIDFFIGKVNIFTKYKRACIVAALQYKNLIYFVFSLLLMFKFINNFFSKPYTLNYAGEYYINLRTVIFDKKELPAYSFEKDLDGNLMVTDLSPLLSFMRNEYRSESVQVFSNHFKQAIIILVSAGIIYAFWVYILQTGKYFRIGKKIFKWSRRNIF